MIIRIIIGALLIYLLIRLVKAWGSGRDRSSPNPPLGEDLVKDSYCETYIPKSHARKAVIEGKTHYFCSQQCLDAYQLRDRA